MMRYMLGLFLVIFAATGCSLLPRSLGGSGDEPTPLSEDLMQATQRIEYRAPARDEVVGCVVVAYDIARDGVPGNVRILESHPAGYFDAEVLNLMKVLRFKKRAKLEHAARLFTYVPPDKEYSRAAAASLCSPVPTHEQLNRNAKETP